MYIDVAVALPLTKTLTYALPDHLAELAAIGKRVMVPLGRRKVSAAAIMSGWRRRAARIDSSRAAPALPRLSRMMSILRGEIREWLVPTGRRSRIDARRNRVSASIPPTAGVLPLRNVTRPDEPRPSFPRDVMLANAPAVEDGFIVVKAVLDKDELAR